MHSAFAANTRKASATERSSQVAQEPAVHPRDAHIHLLCDAMTALHVTGPYRGREPVFRIVRQGDGFFFRVERCDVAHRPEDLLLHAPRRLRQSSIDGRLHIEAMVASVVKYRNASASHDCRSFFAGQPIVREYLLAMLRRNQRTQLSLGIVRPSRM